MADFSLQDLWWLKPKEPDNPLPAMQLGARMVQDRARHDLDKGALANDIARTSLIREEMLYKQQIQTSISEGNAMLAKAASGITDFSDLAQMKPIYDLGARYGHLVGTKGWEGIINTHERAVTAQRLGEEAQSRIDERNRKAKMAASMGWIYPEDGSPPYLVDAKGGTHFAPFHAGLDAGFTPEKTTIGNTELVRTSPNRWQVINKGIPSGKMTDLEKANLSDIRKRRQALVDTLPSDAPKLGMFGGNKTEVEKYSSQTNQISELTMKESSLIQAIEARDSTSAPSTSRIPIITPDGKPGSIPESQLEEALKAGYKRP